MWKKIKYPVIALFLGMFIGAGLAIFSTIPSIRDLHSKDELRADVYEYMYERYRDKYTRAEGDLSSATGSLNRATETNRQLKQKLDRLYGSGQSITGSGAEIGKGIIGDIELARKIKDGIDRF